MTNKIDETKYYDIVDELWMCCDESQFKYYCKAHGERMGCYYCEFNYDDPCDCEE